MVVLPAGRFVKLRLGQTRPKSVTITGTPREDAGRSENRENVHNVSIVRFRRVSLLCRSVLRVRACVRA